jgi:protein required for attachment to host cells
MKKTVTWVLIADGAQARVLENTGPGKGLKQVEGLQWSNEPLRAQDIVTDRPGGGGNGGSMASRVDPVEQREEDFVKNLAVILDKFQQKGAFDRLIIAAAPIALGDIRKAISPAVKKTILAELNKDLTNLPTAQLDQHFQDILAA